MNIVYPALFYYTVTHENETPYFITFPDFPHSATQGDTIADAISMAQEYLGIIVADIIEDGADLPASSNINQLTLEKDNPFKNDSKLSIFDKEKSFISMISVDVSEYLNQQEPVKKTLTIPRWADTLGKELDLNFSKTLTDAIVQKKVGV